MPSAFKLQTSNFKFQTFFFFFEIVIYKDWGIEVIECTAVFLGGAACSAGPVYESAYAAHLQQFILLRGCYILKYLSQQFGSDSLLYGLKYAERIGDGRLANVNDVALLDHMRGLEARTALGDATILACICSNGARLEDARCPQPFVYPCFHVVFIGSLLPERSSSSLFIIIVVHGELYAAQNEGLDGLTGFLYALIHGGLL